MNPALIDRGALPSMAALRANVAVPGADRLARQPAPNAGLRPPAPRFGRRRISHSLLADTAGVWAWSPIDDHAAPTRHRGVFEWAEAHRGCDIEIWASAALTRGSDRIDLRSLERLGAGHDVRTRSVSQWWHHAFVEARRCVNAVTRVARAQICVVEGMHTTWITTEYGQLREVHPYRLAEPTIDALQRALDQRQACPVTVALGQGLSDGHRIDGVRALVLGRLDGEQPPQWLRPASLST